MATSSFAASVEAANMVAEIEKEKSLIDFLLLDEVNRQDFTSLLEKSLEYRVLQDDLFKLISYICSEFNLGGETEFACFDSCDIYVFNKFKQMADSLKSEPGKTATKFLESFSQDFPVIILILVAIVSKFYSQSDDMDYDRVVKIFTRLNIRINRKKIVNTEYKILETIGFSVRRPITFIAVECYLQLCIGSNSVIYQNIYKVSFMLLKLVYFKRNKVYERVFEVLNFTDDQKVIFKTNKKLLAAAVVLTATLFTYSNYYQEHRNILVKESGTPVDYMSCLSRAMTNEILIGIDAQSNLMNILQNFVKK